MKLEEAERALRQAEDILAQPSRYNAEEWMLLAALVGEADLAIREDQQSTEELRLLLAQVVGELRAVTNDFSDPAFLISSAAARRRNKELFSARA